MKFGEGDVTRVAKGVLVQKRDDGMAMVFPRAGGQWGNAFS